MNLEHYLPHLPEIERRLRELKPHALVLGLGPSARMLPLLDQSLLEGVRIWGCNDVESFQKVHDLVVFDGAQYELHPETDRHKAILASNPDRWWIYRTAWEDGMHHAHVCWKGWKHLLPPEQIEKVRVFDIYCIDKHPVNEFGSWPKPMLNAPIPNHALSSPTGMTTIAWREGARRIGLLGVDMIPGQKPITSRWQEVRWFFKHLSRQANEMFGKISQLSPFAFTQWECERVPVTAGDST